MTENHEAALIAANIDFHATRQEILDLVAEALDSPEVYDTSSGRVAAEAAINGATHLFVQLEQQRREWAAASAAFTKREG